MGKISDFLFLNKDGCIGITSLDKFDTLKDTFGVEYTKVDYPPAVPIKCRFSNRTKCYYYYDFERLYRLFKGFDFEKFLIDSEYYMSNSDSPHPLIIVNRKCGLIIAVAPKVK